MTFTQIPICQETLAVINAVSFTLPYSPIHYEVSRQSRGTLKPLSVHIYAFAPYLLGAVFEPLVWTLCYQPPGRWVTAFICHNACNWYELTWLIQKWHITFQKVVSETSLCVKSNFYFPLIQTVFWHEHKLIFHHLWTVQLIKQKSHLTGPNEFTTIHQSHHKCCFHGPFHRHSLVNHVASRPCRRSPERPDPWVTICSGRMECIGAETVSCSASSHSRVRRFPRKTSHRSSSEQQLVAIVGAIFAQQLRRVRPAPHHLQHRLWAAVWPLVVIICFFHKLLCRQGWWDKSVCDHSRLLNWKFKRRTSLYMCHAAKSTYILYVKFPCLFISTWGAKYPWGGSKYL